MALDLTPGSLIRSGSYLLLALIGAILLARRRRHPWNTLVGLAYLVSGASGVLYNLLGGNVATTSSTLRSPILAVTTVLSLVGVACWARFWRPLVKELEAGPRRAVLGLLVVSLVCAIATSVVDLLWPVQPAPALVALLDAWAFALLSTFLLAAVALGAELARAGKPEGRLVWLLVLPGVIENQIYLGQAARLFRDLPWRTALFPLLNYALFVVALAWALRATGRPRGWRAVAMVGAGLGTGVLCALLASAGIDVEHAGVSGILLILADLAALFGVVRFDLLGRQAGRPLVGRATIASLALAALFITAQVAQNFLSDKYGLYLGGAVAGIVVFVASPLQRAAERTMEARRHSTTAMEAYRAQVRLAWADGVLGQKERAMLRAQQDQLGLTAEEARRVDDEEAAAAGHAANLVRSQRGA
jgi:hypothetical protein